MKRILSLLAFVLVLPSLAAAQGAKIAFVDLEYALNNVDEGKKAKAILEQDYKRKKEALQTTEANLVRLENELSGQKLVLSADALRQKEQELDAAKSRYQAEKKAAYEEWQKKEATLTRDLLERLTEIVQQIGKEGGYQFILERHDASVLYAQEDIDLTRQVIERFNKTGGR